MWAKLCRCSFIILTATLVALLPSGAQEKKDEPVKEIPVEQTERGLNTLAMMACVGKFTEPVTGTWNPWSVISVRVLASDENKPLPAWQFDFSQVPPLDQAWLDRTRDGRPLPKILYKELKELGPDLGFWVSFNKAIERAHAAELAQFQKSAAEFEHVVFAQLRATPGRYRGKVITAKGKMTVIRKEDTPRLAAASLGQELPYIYTGWVTTEETRKIPPFTAVFTQLPAEVLKEGEKLDLDVTFHGYFIALVSFPTGKEIRGKQQEMFSPYLVGKTLIVNPAAKKDIAPPAGQEDKDTTPTAAYLLAWTFGCIVVVALFVGILNVWLRRNDRRVQARLAAMRDRQQPFNIEPADEEPPLAQPIRNDEGKPPTPP